MENDVTLVITACNRPLLLKATLESFMKYNTYPIKECILIEDSGILGVNDFAKNILQDIPVNFIYNETNIGLIRSVDKAYKEVKTKYIFHCEDDWEFTDYSFIEKSFEILEKDEKIFTVWLRPYNHVCNHPIIEMVDLPYNIMKKDYVHYNGCLKWSWYGITFNPGLRRTDLCMKFHPYSKIKRENNDIDGEYTVNVKYGTLGYYGAITKNKNGYVKHLGENHHVERKNTNFVIYKENVNYIFESLTGNIHNDNWIRNTFKDWEPNTFRVFNKVKNSEKIAIDIGAWIGFTPIWLCNNFKHVFCIEADKESVKSLEKNLKASSCDNFTIINNAIFSDNRKLYFGPNNFLRNSHLNDSTSQIKNCKSSDMDYMFETITLDDLFTDVNPKDIGLIKVDIEGGEEHILEDLLISVKEYKFPLYISFHLSWWNNKNLDRFSEYFEDLKCYQDNFTIIDNPINYINTNPFGSLLIQKV